MNELIHILVEGIKYWSCLLTNEHIFQLEFANKKLNQGHDEKINDQINSIKKRYYIPM